MNTGQSILNRARDHGVEVTACGDRLKLRSHHKPPDELLAQLRVHKPEIIALLQPANDGWSAADWHALFAERAAIIEFDGGESRERAEITALEELVVEWSRSSAAPVLALGRR